MTRLRQLLCAVFFLFHPLTLPAADALVDPLDSPAWAVMHERILDNEPVVFDDRVVVRTPEFAEDPMNVPVSVTVNALEGIQDIVIFADLNPIQKVMEFKPVHLKPYIAFRFKVEQSTPVRAAVKTSDGVWHVGGRWIDAAGGGCTAPSTGRLVDSWHETLMNVTTRTWQDAGHLQRLRLRIMHPMDTGLAPGIPEFYIEQLTLRDDSGRTMADIQLFQPVSENPVFTFEISNEIKSKVITLAGTDNNGNRLDAVIR